MGRDESWCLKRRIFKENITRIKDLLFKTKKVELFDKDKGGRDKFVLNQGHFKEKDEVWKGSNCVSSKKESRKREKKESYRYRELGT